MHQTPGNGKEKTWLILVLFVMMHVSAKKRARERERGREKTVATQERFGATLLFHCVRFTDHIMQLHIRINAIRNCLSTV